MRTRITIIGLVAALAAVLALTIGPAAHADPVTAPYGTGSGTTDANAEIPCTLAGDGLTSSNYYVNVSLLSPSGGAVNLPANWRGAKKTATTFPAPRVGAPVQV